MLNARVQLYLILTIRQRLERLEQEVEEYAMLTR